MENKLRKYIGNFIMALPVLLLVIAMLIDNWQATLGGIGVIGFCVACATLGLKIKGEL
jgi:hypothetical protein